MLILNVSGIQSRCFLFNGVLAMPVKKKVTKKPKRRMKGGVGTTNVSKSNNKEDPLYANNLLDISRIVLFFKQ